MYCVNCGKQIDDNADVCVGCGVFTHKPLKDPKMPPPPHPKSETNIMALVGFILSFIVPLGGIICSIIGLKQVPKYSGQGKGFAIAGIIISCLSMVLSFLFTVLITVLSMLSYAL